MKITVTLESEEADSLLRWLDARYEEMYPDIEYIREEDEHLVPAIIKLTEALDDAS